MDLSNIPLFQVLSKHMSWLNQRQGVLAQNVANADLPGYRAQDIEKPDFKKILAAGGSDVGTGGKLTLATTAAGHMGGVASSGTFKQYTVGGDSNITGNNVSLEEQVLKVSQNASDYSLTETFYRSQLGLIKMALGSSNGG